jgi:hypothetical protein
MKGRTFSPAAEFLVDLAQNFCQELAILRTGTSSVPHSSVAECGPGMFYPGSGCKNFSSGISDLGS